MNQKKQLHKRLEKILQKAEEDLILLKLKLEKEKERKLVAENKLRNTLIKYIRIDIFKAEKSLIQSVYQIINQDHN
tara:strand:+ start:87574 stop:87801 length:228 start_codon:yes stop_codon:yes gene_type:complete